MQQKCTREGFKTGNFLRHSQTPPSVSEKGGLQLSDFSGSRPVRRPKKDESRKLRALPSRFAQPVLREQPFCDCSLCQIPDGPPSHVHEVAPGTCTLVLRGPSCKTSLSVCLKKHRSFWQSLSLQAFEGKPCKMPSRVQACIVG